MKKQVIGMSCHLCKERFYKNSIVSENELKIDKVARSKIHVVEELPKFCQKCGGFLTPIKKYIPVPKD